MRRWHARASTLSAMRAFLADQALQHLIHDLIEHLQTNATLWARAQSHRKRPALGLPGPPPSWWRSDRAGSPWASHTWRKWSCRTHTVSPTHRDNSDQRIYEHWGERTERERRAERVIGVVHDPCELEVLHTRRLNLDRRTTMNWRSHCFRCCHDWRPSRIREGHHSRQPCDMCSSRRLHCQ